MAAGRSLRNTAVEVEKKVLYDWKNGESLGMKN
jgi:hypothetical protein